MTRTVCFYSIATHLGGAERSLLDLVTRLETRSGGKYRPWLLFPKNEGPLLELLAQRNISFSVLRMPTIFFATSRERPYQAVLRLIISVPAMFLYCLRLAKTLTSSKPAIIHTTGIKCHLLAMATNAFHHVPVLWHLRDILPTGIIRKIFKFISSRPNLSIVANSKATAGVFVPRTREIPVIYNGLDPSTYKRNPNRKFHAAFGIPADAPIVGMLGVVARWKGQTDFIRMAKHLIDSGSNARFVIVGDKIYDTTGDHGFKGELTAMIRELGLADRVFMAGFEKDAVSAINALDVLVHASIRPEPFGRVVLEAMAIGIPVIASALGGVLELVEDGKTGLLYPAGNVTRMAECTTRLLQDAALRAELVERAHQLFISHFTIDAHVDRVIALYDRIAQGGQ